MTKMTKTDSCSPNKDGDWWTRHIAWRLLRTAAHKHAYIPRKAFNAKGVRHHAKAVHRAKAHRTRTPVRRGTEHGRYCSKRFPRYGVYRAAKGRGILSAKQPGGDRG